MPRLLPRSPPTNQSIREQVEQLIEEEYHDAKKNTFKARSDLVWALVELLGYFI
jgi:hypothetical protein